MSFWSVLDVKNKLLTLWSVKHVFVLMPLWFANHVVFVPVSISSAKPIVFVLLCFNLTGKACGACSSASLFGTGRKKSYLFTLWSVKPVAFVLMPFCSPPYYRHGWLGVKKTTTVPFPFGKIGNVSMPRLSAKPIVRVLLPVCSAVFSVCSDSPLIRKTARACVCVRACVRACVRTCECDNDDEWINRHFQ